MADGHACFGWYAGQSTGLRPRTSNKGARGLRARPFVVAVNADVPMLLFLFLFLLCVMRPIK